MSRLARETLALQKYQDACARARAALEPMLDPNRHLTESETRAIVRKVDRLFGLTSDEDSSAVLRTAVSQTSGPPASPIHNDLENAE